MCLASDRWAERRFSSGLPLDSRSAAVTRRFVKGGRLVIVVVDIACVQVKTMRKTPSSLSLSSVSLARTYRLNVLKEFSFSLSLSLS